MANGMNLSDLYQQTLPTLKHQVNIALRMVGDKSVEFDDLMQVGFFALTKAADSYDASKGANFNTYFNWVLRNALQDVVRKSNRNATSYSDEVDETNTGSDSQWTDLGSKLAEVRNLLVNEWTVTYFDARVEGLNDRQARLQTGLTNYRASQAKEEIMDAVAKVSF